MKVAAKCARENKCHDHGIAILFLFSLPCTRVSRRDDGCPRDCPSVHGNTKRTKWTWCSSRRSLRDGRIRSRLGSGCVASTIPMTNDGNAQ